jgi:hypothetical protein
MFRQGVASAGEGLADLFTDAMRAYARELPADGREGPPGTCSRELNERLAAALAGAAATFATASERWWEASRGA